jgi:outer membrane protein assembly factor BamB
VRALSFLVAACFAHAATARTADEIFELSGVKGGLVVHLGNGPGELTAALHRSDAFLVHGLDRDEANVAEARKRIVESGLHGKVTVEHWTRETLPFSDNVVNLVVVDDAGDVPDEEIMRVLRPGGVVVTRKGKGWKASVKPRPADIDEWTHFLRDASNNAVALDKKVAPPKHLQWKCGPMFTRDHDSLASISALTSSNGRIFYIIDEGPTSLIHRPSKWALVARDAFNGKLLWKRDIDRWITQLANFRAGPAQLPRRLVSMGDRVFVTLGLDAPVEMLDAASGKTLRTFPGSEKTEEIIVHDGTLLAAIGDPNILTDAVSDVVGFWQLEAKGVKPVRRRVIAWDIDSGKERWRADDDRTAGYIGLTLTARNERVYYLDGGRVQCRALDSGKPLWDAEFGFKGNFLLNYTPTVVAHEDVILCLNYKRLCAFATADGTKLWERGGAIGFGAAGDLFVIDGLAWALPMTRFGAPMEPKKTDFIGDAGKESWGMDLRSGEVRKRVNRNILPGVHHHRCYRNKATENYLIYGQGGLEFMDIHGTDHSGNLWTRGICQYGVMPANGYVYVPPHPCQCFSQDLLHGFHVLAGSTSTSTLVLEPESRKGPTFADRISDKVKLTVPAKAPGMVWQPPVSYGSPDEWPMFRRDLTRSSSSPVKISGSLGPAWEAKLGGDLTAATVAGKRLFVCSKSEQILYCLDAANGKTLWQLATPGQVDSPPTIVGGLCVFGSVDGSVSCINASDGALRWQFRIGKEERRTVIDDHLESVWPIHGSVLVQRGTVYFAAGRSAHLDGGIRLFAIDLATGKPGKQITFSSAADKEDRVLVNMDLLVSDGKMINMGLAQFDADLNPQNPSNLKTLICDTGFLPDAWFHRENWVLGGVSGTVGRSARTTMATQPRSAQASVGKLLVFNGTSAYGIKNPYSWQKYANNYPTHTGHVHQKYTRYKPEWFPVGSRIFSFDNTVAAAADTKATRPDKKKKRRKPSKEQQRNEKWGVDMPLQPRAIALAADKLIIAGWLDAIAIQPRTGLPLDPQNPDPRNCVLRVLSTGDGTVLGEHKIPAEPAYDGMAIAYGKVYLPLKDGTVLCLSGREEEDRAR